MPDKTPAPPLQSTNNPTTTTPDIASPPSTGLQLSISLPGNDQSKATEELSPFNWLLSDVRPLLSIPNHLNFHSDHSILGRQHRPEYHTNRTWKTIRPRFNRHLKYSLKPETSTWETIFWDSRRKEYTIKSTSPPFQRLVVPPQAIKPFSYWFHSILLHQLSWLIINFPLTQLSRCETLLQGVSPWLNYFVENFQKSSHFKLLLLTNPSLTALSSSLLFSRQMNLSRMQQLIHHLLDLHLFCPYFSNIKWSVYWLFTRTSNSSTNTWRQNTPRPTDITTPCPSTAKWLCPTALRAFLSSWNNLQQRYCC